MRKVLAVFVLVNFLLCSCNDFKKTKGIAVQTDPDDDNTDIATLTEILEKFEEPSQIIKASAKHPGILTGRKGTKISIDPGNLTTESGNPLGQTIEVELKELTNQGQLLRSNAQSVSDGKLLVSGGAYFIGMTSNGEPLRLKEGKTLTVQFPKQSDTKMILFYGQRNGFGQMNWQASTETFKAIQQAGPAKDSTVTPKKKTSDIDMILDYVASEETTATQEERETMVKQQKEYRIMKQVYDEIDIARLGWINCDRFMEAENKTDLYISFDAQDSVKNAVAFLVFKDINSVMQSFYHSNTMLEFTDIPVGYQVHLIAYTVEAKKVFAFSKDLTITQGQKLTLHLKEINEKDFKKLISQ